MVRFFANEGSLGRCRAGERMAVVNPDGTLSPCGLLVRSYDTHEELKREFTERNDLLVLLHQHPRQLGASGTLHVPRPPSLPAPAGRGLKAGARPGVASRPDPAPAGGGAHEEARGVPARRGGAGGGSPGSAGGRRRTPGSSGPCAACPRRRSPTSRPSPPPRRGCGSSWSRSRPTRTGLYGYGCATFTQRADLVPPAVERYLKPFLVGKPADRIEDTWQALYASSYWRNGPVLNNAISGVDMALWDIKGRQAGMPVYQLLGGKAREAADCYAHASGSEIPEVLDARPGPHGSRLPARPRPGGGPRHGRLRLAARGGAGHAPCTPPRCSSRRPTCAARSQLLEAARKELGDEVELLHDVHERISPTQALGFCKDVEQFRLFFLEDPVSPEDIGWFRLIRQQCATPARHGRALQQPARVGPPHLRAAHRLHPRPRLAGGRPHALPQDGGAAPSTSA